MRSPDGVPFRGGPRVLHATRPTMSTWRNMVRQARRPTHPPRAPALTAMTRPRAPLAGVLLMNSFLSAFNQEPASHGGFYTGGNVGAGTMKKDLGWGWFTAAVLQRLAMLRRRPIAFALMGKGPMKVSCTLPHMPMLRFAPTLTRHVSLGCSDWWQVMGLSVRGPCLAA